MFRLWQSYDNGRCTLDWRSHVQAEAAALQTSLGRPELSTTMASCGIAGWCWCKLDVQLSWHITYTALHIFNPCQGYHLHFWAGLKAWRSSKVPWRLGLPWFSQKQEDNRKTMMESQTQGKPAQLFGTEGWKRLSSRQFLSCCIEAFSKQRALVGLVIIRRQISLMSLSMSFKCSTISSTGIYFFWKGLLVRSKCFCECYLGILRLKNASFV